MSIDAALAELTAVLSADQISCDDRLRDRYSHDAWPLQTKLELLGLHEYRPQAIVFAKSAADVVAVVRAAGRHHVPVTARGLGSSVTGQPLATRGGIVLDMCRVLGDLEIDPVDCTVTVGAGWNGGELENKLKRAGHTLGHSPQSLLRSTVGGWVATTATGQLSSRYGGIEDMVVGIEVVLADGHVAWFETNPRAALGPDLKRLFIGAEGTLGVVTKVKLRIVPLPAHFIVEAFHLPSVNATIDVMRRIAQSGQRPSLVRGYDEVEAPHALQDAGFDGCVLFLGNEGAAPVAAAEHAWQSDLVARAGGTSLGSAPVESWLRRRFDFSKVEARLSLPGGYAETIEVAHTWRHIEELYLALKAELTPLADEVNGHFSHVYPQGTSLYLIVFGRAEDDVAAVARLEGIWRTAMKTTASRGGVLSHHHGVGLARVPYMRAALGSGFTVLERVKSALDPDGLFNPGKLGLD